MKRVLFFVIVFLGVVTIQARAQLQSYLWPIEGAKAGDNIISAPQSYIDGELNFNQMFIGAPEGTRVLSPADGTITFISVGWYRTLNSAFSCSPCYEQNFDISLKNNGSKFNVPGGKRFFHGTLAIRTKDGKTIHIWGLSGSETLKTGQVIKRGDPVGKVAYSYFKIEEPSIKLSIDKGGKASDPMTPFGIKSSFLYPAEIKPILSLTKGQAKEDFMVYINVLKEAFPGLHNVITQAELENYIAQTLELIDSKRGDLKFNEFQEIMKGAIVKINDSHIYFLRLPWETESKPPSFKRSVEFGWINDTLMCTNAILEHKHLIGREITSVNGMNADEIKMKIISSTAGYDAKIESYIDYHLALASFFTGFDTDLVVEFADGESMELKRVSSLTSLTYSLNLFNSINRHRGSYNLSFPDTTTACIGLSNFNLNQVQVEDIANFISFISNENTPNLIIDLRNNGGGHAEALEKLYSYIAGEPFTLNSYSRVNKRTGFESFRYSLNRMEDDSTFEYYSAEEGKEGFYNRPEGIKTIVPDPEINFKGNVYVLINELSASAATLFAAMLVRNNRGIVVGRETRTAFHFMNALQFADIRLPNSMIRINIPLVHCVFDDATDERTPYGRGVLPDYPVPITIEELSFENGDAIMNYTLQLIKNRILDSKKETKILSVTLLWIALFVVIIIVSMFMFYKRVHGR